MSEKPKCPGCGADMELMHLCKAAFCYACTKCGWDSPIGIDSESAFRMAMRRVEPKNHVLTLEEVSAHCAEGADAMPLWLENRKKKDVSRWMLADTPEFICDSRMTVKYLLGTKMQGYGETWRFWLRKPTKEEMEGTPWES